jgi:hypothetical protein
MRNDELRKVIHIVVIGCRARAGLACFRTIQVWPKDLPVAPDHTGCHRGSAVGSSASEKEQHLQPLSVRFMGGTA